MYKYKIGDVVTGKVTGIADYGIFVSLPDGTSGLIHISEISDHFVKNVSDYATLGEKIRFEVVGYRDDKHYKLSIKSFLDNADRKKINETTKGFTTLKKLLPVWVKDKTREIKENAKKNNNFG